jgi:tRNA-specific 2-thiouridylase
LHKGSDPGKDQSYFLYTIGQKALSKVLFPVGNMLKPELRQLAHSAQLATSAKKDSTGICFIGKRDFKEFLSKYLAYTPGQFQTLDGKVVGEHEGMAYYTPGQRKGMGIGGPGEPWFVVGKDVERNIVYLEQGTRHPALYCDELTAVEPSWVSGEAPAFPFSCKAKVRYRQQDQECIVETNDDGGLRVRFSVPQRAVSVRQSIVFYEGDNCLGGAMIAQAGPSYYHQGHSLPDLIAP